MGTTALANDVLAALGETTYCRTCRHLRLEILAGLSDRGVLARKLAGALRSKASPERLHALVRAADERLDKHNRWAQEHLAEPHEPRIPKPHGVARTGNKRDADRVTCPGCGGRVHQRADGRLGAHQSPRGVACAVRYPEVSLTELPPVDLGDVSPRGGGRGSNTLPATGRCHECGKPVSGERRFCGYHAATRLRGG